MDDRPAAVRNGEGFGMISDSDAVPKCTTCLCDMQPGVVADYGDVGTVFSLRWHPIPLTPARRSFWERFLNLKVKGDLTGIPVCVYRCITCGRLELFALAPARQS